MCVLKMEIEMKMWSFELHSEIDCKSLDGLTCSHALLNSHQSLLLELNP